MTDLQIKAKNLRETQRANEAQEFLKQQQVYADMQNARSNAMKAEADALKARIAAKEQKLKRAQWLTSIPSQVMQDWATATGTGLKIADSLGKMLGPLSKI